MLQVWLYMLLTFTQYRYVQSIISSMLYEFSHVLEFCCVRLRYVLLSSVLFCIHYFVLCCAVLCCVVVLCCAFSEFEGSMQHLNIQVARQHDPQQDAAKVLAVRRAVGHTIVLRADANRKWSLNQAVAFGHAVWGANLQVLTKPPCVHYCSSSCRVCTI